MSDANPNPLPSPHSTATPGAARQQRSTQGGYVLAIQVLGTAAASAVALAGLLVYRSML